MYKKIDLSILSKAISSVLNKSKTVVDNRKKKRKKERSFSLGEKPERKYDFWKVKARRKMAKESRRINRKN